MESSFFEFWTCQLLPTGYQSNNKKRMTNSVDPDEIAHYDRDLHCLKNGVCFLL